MALLSHRYSATCAVSELWFIGMNRSTKTVSEGCIPSLDGAVMPPCVMKARLNIKALPSLLDVHLRPSTE